MGTNYYWHTNRCQCCGYHDQLHIGKKSGGWAFQLHAHPDHPTLGPILSWKRWRDILTAGDGDLEDEYGETVDTQWFIALVESQRDNPQLMTGRKWVKRNRSPYTARYLEQIIIDEDGYELHGGDWN